MAPISSSSWNFSCTVSGLVPSLLVSFLPTPVILEASVLLLPTLVFLVGSTPVFSVDSAFSTPVFLVYSPMFSVDSALYNYRLSVSMKLSKVELVLYESFPLSLGFTPVSLGESVDYSKKNLLLGVNYGWRRTRIQEGAWCGCGTRIVKRIFIENGWFIILVAVVCE